LGLRDVAEAGREMPGGDGEAYLLKPSLARRV